MASITQATKAVIDAARSLATTTPLDLSTPEQIDAKLDEILAAAGLEGLGSAAGCSPDGRALLGEVLVLAVRAELDHLASITQLWKILETDTRLPTHLNKEATALILKAAKMDHADSQIELAKRLVEGAVIPKDDYEAIGWLISAARTAQDQTAVTKDMATLLLTSTQLPPASLSDVRDVLVNGCRDAVFQFGERASVETWEKYATGRGEGIEVDAYALHELAGIYATGEGGVPESSAVATNLYIRSASAGCWKGLSALADLHDQKSLPASSAEASEALRPASKQLQLLGATTPLVLSSTRKDIVAGLPAGAIPDVSGFPAPPGALESRRPAGEVAKAVKPAPEAEKEAREVVEGYLAAKDENAKVAAEAKVVGVLQKLKVQYLKARSEEGDVEAMVEFAKLTDNATEKKSWLQKAAEKGIPEAYYFLYEISGDADPAAADYLKKAVELKYPEACYRRGLQLEKGTFWEEKNAEKALEMYRLAGDSHAEAQHRLSLLLLASPTAATHYTEIQAATRNSLLHGSLAAAALYGAKLYWEGKTSGGPWIERAKDRGAVSSAPMLADDADELKDVRVALAGMEAECRRLLASPAGVDIVEKARKGDAEAQMGSARLLKAIGLSGIATTVFLGNLERPTVNVDARYEIARAFHFGIGDIKQNLTKAVCWYHAAARAALDLIRAAPTESSGSYKSRSSISLATWPTSAVLSLLAIADLYAAGSTEPASTDAPPSVVAAVAASATSLTGGSFANAVTPDAGLAAKFRQAARFVLEWSAAPASAKPALPDGVLPGLKVAIDVDAFLDAEAKTGGIRQQGAAGVLCIGEVDMLIRPPKNEESKPEAEGGAKKAEEIAKPTAAAAPPPPAAADAVTAGASETTAPPEDGKAKKRKKPTSKEPGSAGCCVVM
ncbi:hypothetical protein HDU96_007747 [Phlyctochytrium bullatum]|nr:hypothetical protein HDU96_007747 [Phlyctochytrium bullatum]